MADLELILHAQRAFFRSGKTRDINFRKATLHKLKKILIAREPGLYAGIADDFGKSGFETYATELSSIYKEIDYFLKELERLARPRKARTNLLNLPGRSRIHPEPLGSTLIIGAWNYPYVLTLGPLVASIAAGNTCIVKPSELPLSTMRLIAELINDNFPEEYLHVVEGEVNETTELLKLRFDKIFFTGSPRVGRIVYEAAARHLCPVTLELGGKSPAIVTEHADLKVAARRITWGKFINAGQTCIAPDYILVHQNVKDKLCELLIGRLTESSYESGSEHYVRIINERNFDRLIQLIDPEKVIYGGKSDRNSLYIQPTLMDKMTWDDQIMQDEIFGPILPILSYTDLEESLERISGLEKPLSAYLFSDNPREQELFKTRVSFGGACINDTLMHYSNPDLPFGGVGQSGTGSYHGKYGFETFSHFKPVLERATWADPDMKYPPYTKRALYWLRKLL